MSVCSAEPPFPKEPFMKHSLVKIVLALLLLFGGTSAMLAVTGGDPPPICNPFDPTCQPPA